MNDPTWQGTGNTRKVLIVEDDEGMLAMTQMVLEKAGYLVMPARSGKTAMAWLQSPDKPHLIILDLGLPDMHGTELCGAIKKNSETHNVPVIILTANTENRHRINAHKAQADLYLNKNIKSADLLEAVRLMLLRADTVWPKRGLLHRGGLEVDPETRSVFFNGKTMDGLSHQLFTLLYILVAYHPNVLSRRFILSELGPGNRDREVDVLISLLRRELKPIFGDGLVETIPGEGYRLRLPAPTVPDSSPAD